MKLVVGFICYNQVTANYLAYFLPSLKKALRFLDPKDYQVMAYDNSDKGEHVNRLALEFFSLQEKLDIKYYSGNKNIGFGAAYNFLIEKANKISSDYFLIINPDTILDEEAIFNLVKTLDKNQKLAALSPKILRWDFENLEKTNQIDSCGLILKPGLKFIDLGQGEIDCGQYDKAVIMGASGAATMLSLKKVKKIIKRGLYFDPKFFMYKEDCDLAYRIYRAGLQVELVSDAVIYHDRTASFYGKGPLKKFLNQFKKSSFIKTHSFYGQHRLYRKYFKDENFLSQIVILLMVLKYLIYSLIFDQKNLKHYKSGPIS